MTFKSNCVIAIGTPDKLKNLERVLNQQEAKPKPIAPCTREYPRALRM